VDGLDLDGLGLEAREEEPSVIGLEAPEEEPSVNAGSEINKIRD
jgi:hypothetical protein